MTKNVGGIDRVIRIIAGLVIIGLGFYFQSWWGAIGLLPLGTGLTARCGPYALFGVSTCKIAEKES